MSTGAGLRCPKCGGNQLRVRCTVQRDGQIRRYRACLQCHHHFVTTESHGIGRQGRGLKT